MSKSLPQHVGLNKPAINGKIHSASVGERSRISELLMLRFDVAQSTVFNYMLRSRSPPSNSWQDISTQPCPSESPRFGLLNVEVRATSSSSGRAVAVLSKRSSIVNLSMDIKGDAPYTAIR